MKSVRLAKKPSSTRRSICPRSTGPKLIVIFSLLSASAIFFGIRHLGRGQSYHPFAIPPPSVRMVGRRWPNGPGCGYLSRAPPESCCHVVTGGNGQDVSSVTSDAFWRLDGVTVPLRSLGVGVSVS